MVQSENKADTELSDILMKLVKMATDHFRDIHSVTTTPQNTDIAKILPKSCPKSGTIDATFNHILTEIVPAMSNPWSSRYFGLVTGGVTPAALAADWLVSLIDNNMILNLPKDSAAHSVDQAAIDMLLDLVNLPANVFCGRFTTGATAANILGLCAGRQFVCSTGNDSADIAQDGLSHHKIRIISCKPHSSIYKAASLTGIGRANIINLSSFENLEQLLTIHISTIVVVGFGEVNTGNFPSFSYLKHVRELCTKYNAWLHVDAAFGLFARCYNSNLAAGLELSDSITSDCHKYLNVPYDCGVFFIRRTLKSNLSATFATKSAYLVGDDNLDHPQDYGIENSQRFRALPVYATLLTYGKDGCSELISRTVEFAKHMHKYLDFSEKWEVLVPECVFCIVLFRSSRPEFQSIEGNARLLAKINATKKIYMTSTVYEGSAAIRCAVVNWSTNLEKDWEIVEEVLRDV
jgi:glutamate/tyrosine decarboxylase-like PLP-dependent enzyme